MVSNEQGWISAWQCHFVFYSATICCRCCNLSASKPIFHPKVSTVFKRKKLSAPNIARMIGGQKIIPQFSHTIKSLDVALRQKNNHTEGLLSRGKFPFNFGCFGEDGAKSFFFLALYTCYMNSCSSFIQHSGDYFVFSLQLMTDILPLQYKNTNFSLTSLQELIFCSQNTMLQT